MISVYYSLIFMAGGGFISYISLYYSFINLDNSQIGLISAVMACTALVAQPLLGTISDKSEKKNGVLKTILLLSALTTWLIPLAGKALWSIIAANIAFSFFHNAINPMSDTITLELAGKYSFKFSRVRLAGSLGYAIMAAVAGWIFSYNIWYIFPVFFTLRILAYVISFFIPAVRGYKYSENQAGFLELFKDKKLVLFYSYAFILSSTFGFFSSFHAIYSKEVGISTALLGIGIMVGSFSQFPFMLVFDRVYKKFGIANILVFCGLAYGIRWFLYATSLNSATIVPLWALHGLNYMVLYLCLTEYVGFSVPKELRTRGQMMNAIVLMGLSSVAGGYLGGIISAVTGLRLIFEACAVICFLALIVFFIITRFYKDFRADAIKG